MNFIEKIIFNMEARKMLDALKAKVQQYGPVVIATLSTAITVASFFYGPVSIGGATIPAADGKLVLATLFNAATWIVHHFSKPAVVPAAPASLPVSK